MRDLGAFDTEFEMRAVDLFCGCGGLSLGLTKAGVDVHLAIDSWGPAVECYSLNFAHPVELADLSEEAVAIARIREEQVDLIAGGPPCQEFSHAGKREEGARADLTLSFARIIQGVKPRFFLMENVDRAQNSAAFKEAKRLFRRAGYGLTCVVLNAANCGVPQNRKRFFCVGHLGEVDDFLLERLLSGLKSPTSVKQYLRDEIDIEVYYRHPRNYSRRGIYSVHEPAPTMRGVNRPLPGGYPGHAGDAAPVSSDIRPLTTMERARIQTFPKQFKWVGTKTVVEQMIGNAVPVNLAKYVGKCLMEHSSSSSRAQSDSSFQLVG